MPKKIILNWKDVEKDINVLVRKIQKHNNFSKIVCIAKGGMMVAYFIAKALNIKYIEIICMSHYEDTKMQSKVTILPVSKEVDIRKNWLIVDDLVDTGDTALLAKKYFPESKLAVLYKKPSSKVTPEFYTKDIEEWVVFPWESIVMNSYKLN